MREQQTAITIEQPGPSTTQVAISSAAGVATAILIGVVVTRLTKRFK